MKPIIYQIFVRLAGNRNSTVKPYGTIEENGCGKFNDLDQHFLEEIRAFGATHIWLTGVISHATLTDYSTYRLPANHPHVVKGRAGSPYAIRDYYDVCPDLAVDINRRMEEFEALIERCKTAGLVPIIDFVPNHVAREYHSKIRPEGVSDLGEHDQTALAFHPQNNFYYIPGQRLRLPEEVQQLPYAREKALKPFAEDPAKVTGNDQFTASPGINDWYETIKLNYGVDYQRGGAEYFDPLPATWEKMLDILLFWAGKGAKGFRCDMAEMVPVAFWKWAIREVKAKYPDTLFIAEIYNPGAYHLYHEIGGFDYLYDKEGLYNLMREVMTGGKPAASLSQAWKDLEGLDACMLRFLENHDEQRIASPQFAGDMRAGIPGMAVAATMHQGPLMIYFGQEMGEKAAGVAGFSGEDGRTTIFDYFHVPAFQQWFNQGRCNNEKLNPDQIRLKETYTTLLHLAQDPVITQGHFYDLMWFNQGKEDFDDRHLYCFLRWENVKAWLVVSSFCQNDNILAYIRIPSHFFEVAEMNRAETLQINAIQGITNLPKEMNLIQAENIGIPIEINPYSYIIISINA
ncbi:MAG: alpha-amylase family protein [Bacteroides sp.]|jgi:hypothetical protein|nr:alpha-amylase family protein [Bacteroides sp.]